MYEDMGSWYQDVSFKESFELNLIDSFDLNQIGKHKVLQLVEELPLFHVTCNYLTMSNMHA